MRWQIGRVTSLNPMKVRTDTASLSFVWAQTERVKDEHADEENSETSEEPPPPPPRPADGRAFSGDEAGASGGAELSAEEEAEEELSARIAEAAKRSKANGEGEGRRFAPPPRPGAGTGLDEDSSASEAGDQGPAEVEWHGLEPVPKTGGARHRQVSSQNRSASADSGRPGQGRGPPEAAQYRSSSAPPEQPRRGGGAEASGRAKTPPRAAAAAPYLPPQTTAVHGGGQGSDSEVFSDSDEEPAKKGGQAVHVWSMEQSFQLAGGEAALRGLAPLMDPDRCSSVRDAVDQLNEGSIEVPGGICAVFSSARSAYFLLYRQDKEEHALAEFGEGAKPTEPRPVPRTEERRDEPVSVAKPPSKMAAQSGASRRPRPSGPLVFRFRGHFSDEVPRLEFEVEWKGLPDNPPMVGKTKPDGAAEQRGIVTGDLISELNAQSTIGRTREELLPALKARPLLLSVDRVYDDIDAREPILPLELKLEKANGSSDHGMELEFVGRNGSVLIVAEVREDSPAWVSGLVAGDAVVAVNGRKVAAGGGDVLKSSKHGWPLVIQLQRWALGTSPWEGDAQDGHGGEEEFTEDDEEDSFEEESDGR